MTWTHPQCEACWVVRELHIDQAGHMSCRRPTRVVDPDAEVCCYCGKVTIVGIYRRSSPEDAPFCPDHEE